MSYGVKAWRGPSRLRAAITLAFGCVLLGGCSSGSGRFSSFSFGSGYEPAPPAKSAAGSARETSAYRAEAAQPVSYQPQQAGSYQLGSANPAQANGYLQLSRVDLPPLPARQGPSGTKMADGYGPYNRPPVADGVYTAPRVYNPYDEPVGAPPPSGVYSGGSDRNPYGRGAAREASPPPPNFYKPPDDRADVYEPKLEGMFRDNPPAGEGRNWGYGRRGPERGALSERPAYGPDEGGGRTVIVAPGETLYTLARRWGVTVDMIARANGLTTPYVRPGAVLLIPRADPAAYGRAPASMQTAPGVQSAACTGERCHVVKPGETLASIARAHNVSDKQLAETNNLTGSALKPGQKLIVPAANQPPRQALADRQDRAPAPAAEARKVPAPGLSEPSPNGVNSAPGAAPAPLRQAPDTRTAQLQPLPEASCEAALANPQPRMGATFRKPVEGKTIAPFGPQKDGTVNEGITISVPKGTPVKAAENGVVAYAGDELPGFGNLILIRHADDYITAYAHADTILVKKCDVIKRGQTIATAGTTGDAAQPQLHFEVRKNSRPVDPLPLLGS
jgi:murein DD-endopeptidase MepM/ murein hydrolase activator NlpD